MTKLKTVEERARFFKNEAKIVAKIMLREDRADILGLLVERLESQKKKMTLSHEDLNYFEVKNMYDMHNLGIDVAISIITTTLTDNN